jgi:hypothetical protein
VDLKQICRSLFNQPEFTVNGVKYDTHRLEQNGPRTGDLLANYNHPNEELLAAVNCQPDMSTHALSSMGGPLARSARVTRHSACLAGLSGFRTLWLRTQVGEFCRKARGRRCVDPTTDGYLASAAILGKQCRDFLA